MKLKQYTEQYSASCPSSSIL